MTTTLQLQPTDRKKADAWMLQGIRQHELCDSNIRNARKNAVNAGLFFTSARSAWKDGDWGVYLGSYSHKIKPRAVYFYMELAREALEWAKKDHPQLTGAKLEEAAATMVMQSPKPLIALCRELGHMRKFGEYDEIKYAAQKRLGNGPRQLELNFADVCSWLEPLEHFGESNFSLLLPEGLSETDALGQLDKRLKSISDKVRAKLKDVIEA